MYVTANYIKLRDIIKEFARVHGQVKRFASDFPEQIDFYTSSGQTFPMMYMSPNDTTYQLNQNIYNIRLYVLDIIQKDRTNIDSLVSVGSEVLRDICLYFGEDNLDAPATILGDPFSIPVNNFSTSYLAGHYMNISIQCDATSFCDIPFLEDPIISGISSNVVYTNSYLQCDTILSCHTLTEYIDEYFVNVAGDTMTGNLTINAGPSGFTYVDGNQGVGKVLVTDANGVASWDNPPAYSLSQFMFINTASSVAGYHQMVPLSQYSAATLSSYSTGLTTSARVMGIFSTNVGQPNTTVLPIGNFTFNFDTLKASGSVAYFVHAELYKRTTGGTETFLLSSETSSISILNTNISHSLNASNTSIINLNVTDRLVARIMGRTSTSTATVSLRIDGSTNAGMIMPIAAATSGDFVPYQNASANVDLGTFALNAGTITSGGTNLYNIFSTVDTNDITRVQPGTNIQTGGTGNNPIVSTVASPSFNNITSSGTSQLHNVFGDAISATTFFSGSTTLGTIIYNIAGQFSGGSSSGGGFSGWTGSVGQHSIIQNNNTGNVSGYHSIVGGYGNISQFGYQSFIGNGSYNMISGGCYNAIIGSGVSNRVGNHRASVLGGQNNIATGLNSAIGGGESNLASTNNATVAGGAGNQSTGGYTFTVGRGNQATAAYSSVGGGFSNTATGSFSKVGGGGFNSAAASASVVGGGSANLASGGASSVLGGTSNTASANNSSVLGGSGNTAAAIFSSVLGGSGITATQINTAYVPFLNIQSATTDNSVTNVLVKDSTGKVFSRDASTFGASGNFLPLSGGTLTGATSFTSGLTGNVFYTSAFSTTVPAFSNSLDSNTGLMFDGPDILSLHTGGRQAFLINASGAITNGANAITTGFQTEFTGNTKLSNVLVTSITGNTYQVVGVTGGTANTGQTIDWSLSDQFTYTLSGNTTFSFNNNLNGRSIMVGVTQSSSQSGLTVSWPSSATTRWPDGNAPSMTSTTGKTDVYVFAQLNGLIYGTFLQNY